MKLGKFIKLETYNNVKIGYGTVDFINLKSVYLKFNSWVKPFDNDEDFADLIKINKRKIKFLINNSDNIYFKKESIIDLDISLTSLKKEKKSFMNMEITLFTNDNEVLFKDKEFKKFIKNFIIEIIDILSIEKKLFNFYKTKD